MSGGRTPNEGVGVPPILTEGPSNPELCQLRAVLDGASDAYLCADASASIVDANRAAEALFGFRREELVGADLVALLVPVDRQDAYRDVYQQVLDVGGTEEPVESTIVRADGARVGIELSSWVTDEDGVHLTHTLYRDVTERQRLRHELADQARRLSEAQALTGVGSWEWELATDAVVWSEELDRIVGLPEGTLRSYETFIRRLHPDDRARAEAEIESAVLAGQMFSYEARIVRPDGGVRWIAAHGDAVTDDDGVVRRVRGTVQDVSERKVAQIELERLAGTDALTGLANRSELDVRLESTIDGRATTGEPVALLSLDIDGLKPVNDTHGHPAGDTVLITIAERLTECVRPSDTVARVGGDEFAVLLPGADRSHAAGIAERLVAAASEPVPLDDATTVVVGASVGIAIRGTSSTGIGELRRQADQAMYSAKRGGRGRHAVFTQSLESTSGASLTVDPRDAREWATYLTRLRSEIDRCKADGVLPAGFRAPASITRTLDLLLAAIEHLPHQPDAADLVLPDPVAFEEFIYYHGMVQDWADAQADRGVLATRRPSGADAFWAQLCETLAHRS